eukprot:705378-Amorphochlora_amoeboformis.AAC.1
MVSVRAARRFIINERRRDVEVDVGRKSSPTGKQGWVGFPSRGRRLISNRKCVHKVKGFGKCTIQFRMYTREDASSLPPWSRKSLPSDNLLVVIKARKKLGAKKSGVGKKSKRVKKVQTCDNNALGSPSDWSKKSVVPKKEDKGKKSLLDEGAEEDEDVDEIKINQRFDWGCACLRLREKKFGRVEWG